MARLRTISGLLSAMIFSAVATLPAQAGTLSGLWNTGYDSSGNLITTNGVADGHYSVAYTPAPITGNPGSSVNVVAITSGFPVASNWIPAGPPSAWISPNNNPSPGDWNSPAGTYAYTLTFNASSAGAYRIGGLWAVDNRGTDILVDGVSTGLSTVLGPPDGSSYLNWTSFSVTTTLGAGSHTLTFVTTNYDHVGGTYQPTGNPTGLRVEFDASLIPNVDVPEPATMAMFGIGMAGMAGYRWRRRKPIAA